MAVVKVTTVVDDVYFRQTWYQLVYVVLKKWPENESLLLFSLISMTFCHILYAWL